MTLPPTQPNWTAVAEATGSKAHTLYCRYNTHVMKPLGLTSAKGSKRASATATINRKRKTTAKVEKETTGSEADAEDANVKQKKARRAKKEKKQKPEETKEMGGEIDKVKREDSADASDKGETWEQRSSDVDGEFEYDDAGLSHLFGYAV